MRYLATINTPGYSPWDDEPPTFDTAQEAWLYLADERRRAEDDCPIDADGIETGEYTQTIAELEHLALHAEYGNVHEDWPVNPDGTGVVYADTPGYDGNHDLGLAYSVSLTTEEN